MQMFNLFARYVYDIRFQLYKIRFFLYEKEKDFNGDRPAGNACGIMGRKYNRLAITVLLFVQCRLRNLETGGWVALKGRLTLIKRSR